MGAFFVGLVILWYADDVIGALRDIAAAIREWDE